MNPNLLTTVVLRQHLERAYREVGEDLWPILGRIIREISEENQYASNDQDRFDHECGPRA
jgi:hypothetical protein